MITVSDMQTVQNFLKEAYFVINVNHKNLIPLLELTIHSGRPCMIFPFYKNGNVSAYLKKNQNTSQAKLIDFAVDIAEGLKYIHNNNYIYCELMAGNCFLEDHYEANQLLTSSWKWFALELLKNETVFTTETDVWAFGIVLYEVFSKGKEPYDDISTPHYLLQTLEDGNPLTQPPDCPDCIYDVMKKCWNKDPALRPSISSIFGYLKTAQSQTEVKKRITSSSNAYVG
ncbi:hypothetical protein LSH36_202g07038 [Paralvinella palmiformis]|uniref:Protein kinase domain-containing protein n=1 Tax=Paralvinella palmiformis TaxID=53620 RepID=A0AAD9JQ86_9ANNE|nr:hypothetical protein LSH36_202g07038 [Paralvinella palmiformis]